MRYTQGTLYLNSQERCQIANTSYYFTWGDTMELYNSTILKRILGKIKHDFDKGYYFLFGKKKIFNLSDALARVAN